MVTKKLESPIKDKYLYQHKYHICIKKYLYKDILKNQTTKNLTLKLNGLIQGEIPIDALSSMAPKYDRQWVKKKLPKNIKIK